MALLDTSPAATDLQVRILKGMAGQERLLLAFDLSEFARSLTFARIEQDYPEFSERQRIREFLRCILPQEQVDAIP